MTLASLKILAGPLLGAVIGYCTNYIAVKMLFHPRQEIRVFGHRLPFTPGAIPKGKPRLAKAVGNVVAGKLVTPESLTRQLTSESMKAAFTQKITKVLTNDIRHTSIQLLRTENSYVEAKERLSQSVTNQIILTANDMDIGSIVKREGAQFIDKWLEGSMFRLFVGQDMIESISSGMGTAIDTFIRDHGEEYILPEVQNKIDELEQNTLLDIMHRIEPDQERMEDTLIQIYEKVIADSCTKVLDKLNLAGMVEDTINAMEVKELENMVLSVMKKELNMIVNLGALIGFCIGLLNLLLR